MKGAFAGLGFMLVAVALTAIRATTITTLMKNASDATASPWGTRDGIWLADGPGGWIT